MALLHTMYITQDLCVYSIDGIMPYKLRRNMLALLFLLQDARSALLEMCEKLNLFSACSKVSASYI